MIANERMEKKIMEKNRENLPVSDLLSTTMEKMREMIDANTIIGEPITTADGTTLVPVSKVTFGFVGGGSDFTKKSDIAQKSDRKGFGGGTGAGVTVTPIAFITSKNDKVDIIYVTPTTLTTVDRIIDAVPTVMDKVTEFMNQQKDDITE